MASAPWVIVYAGSATETAMLYSLLEAEEIPARVSDGVVPAPPGNGAVAKVEVLVPEDQVDDAQDVVNEFLEERKASARKGAPAFRPWECPCCHERNDGTFDICWNCQTARE